MSIKIMSLVWEIELKASDKLVLLALADHANDDGECYPSFNKIEKKSGLSRRTLIRTINRLEEYGFLKKEKRENKDGSQSSNLYILTVLEGGVNLTPRGDTVSRGECHGVTGVVSQCHPLYINHQYNRHINPKKNTKKKSEQNIQQEHKKDKSLLKDNQKTIDKDFKLISEFILGLEWFDFSKWKEWAEHRREIKKPLTKSSAKKQIKALGKFLDEGFSMSEVIDNSIEKSYQGLFAPNAKNSHKKFSNEAQSAKLSYKEVAAKKLNERDEKLIDDKKISKLFDELDVDELDIACGDKEMPEGLKKLNIRRDYIVDHKGNRRLIWVFFDKWSSEDVHKIQNEGLIDVEIMELKS